MTIEKILTIKGHDGAVRRVIVPDRIRSLPPELRNVLATRHPRAVMRYSGELADLFGFSSFRKENLLLAALLHDIGKGQIDSRIWTKPGSLSTSELEIARTHPVRAQVALSGVPRPESVFAAIRHHHERWNGTGYPSGLKGEEIPLEARIIAVADAYDAMTHDRPYKAGISSQEARAELQNSSGVHYCPTVVAAFLTMV